MQNAPLTTSLANTHKKGLGKYTCIVIVKSRLHPGHSQSLPHTHINKLFLIYSVICKALHMQDSQSSQSGANMGAIFSYFIAPHQVGKHSFHDRVVSLGVVFIPLKKKRVYNLLRPYI